MILYLSSAFLDRVRFQWKPNLTGFLLGDRNFYFFAPDTLIEVPNVNPETIESFLKEKMSDSPQWELLGFLSDREGPPVAGYVQVSTRGAEDPAQWQALLYFLEDSHLVPKRVEIKLPST